MQLFGDFEIKKRDRERGREGERGERIVLTINTKYIIKYYNRLLRAHTSPCK